MNGVEIGIRGAQLSQIGKLIMDAADGINPRLGYNEIHTYSTVQPAAAAAPADIHWGLCQ